MYTLTSSDISKFDLSKANQFVEFWNQFYSYQVEASDENKNKIDYFKELDVAGDLTESTVRLLLRWKDPRFLTDPQ